MPSMSTEFRDRLLTYGPRPLADHELLEALGVTAEDVEKIGGIHALFAAEPEPFALTNALGVRKAERVIAALELGRRSLAVQEQRPKLQTPDAIARYLLPSLEALRREAFHVLCFNSRNILLRDVRVAEGAMDVCPVDPKEVFSAALAAHCVAIVLAHNHPSGDPEPSPQDIALTEQLRQGARLLGMKVLDHIILGEAGSYTSFVERGLIRQ